MREPRLRSSPSFFHPSTNRRMYRFASNGEMGEPCGMPRRLSRASVVRVFLPRVGKTPRIALAVIEVANNVRGELSAHVITISKLNGKNIACTIECVTHDGQSLGII